MAAGTTLFEQVQKGEESTITWQAKRNGRLSPPRTEHCFKSFDPARDARILGSRLPLAFAHRPAVAFLNCTIFIRQMQLKFVRGYRSRARSSAKPCKKYDRVRQIFTHMYGRCRQTGTKTLLDLMSLRVMTETFL
jgi:hypothetical protein